MTSFKTLLVDFSRSIGIKYCLVIVILLAFINSMRSISNVDMMHSFINEKSVQDFLAKNRSFVPTSSEKIDWHDYNLIQEELRRRGIGEHGKPVDLTGNVFIFDQYGENAVASDIISLNRSLPDSRPMACNAKTYIESLPSVSIVIPFYNENVNTLLRTVHSVINRSPSELIKEVIIVDDASTTDYFQENKDYFIAKCKHTVKLLKLSKHYGLIRAKLHGAMEATGDVLVFLESHSEVNVNWLPPLLEPIALDYRTVMCPQIDNIDEITLEYYRVSSYRGGFDWSLNFRQIPLTKKDKLKIPEPYKNPVVTSGIFAISRLFFWELGGYDPGLLFWGGDQYELSFKIWMCGGQMFIAPCSRVGHVDSKDGTKYLHYGYGDFVGRNYRRIADVWMDDYAQIVYQDPRYSKLSSGDISEQQAIRRRLNCMPFNWFLLNVFDDILKENKLKIKMK